MAKPNTVTPDVEARVAHWARFGLGREAIAAKLKGEGIRLSGRGVSRVLARAPKKTVSTNGGRRPSVGRQSAVRRGETLAAAVTEELELVVAANAVDAALKQLHLWARDIRALAAELLPRSKEGGRNAAVFGQLVRLEIDLARAIRDLTPPTPPDPTVDPSNLEAKRLLIATVEALVAQEEVAK